MLNKQGPGTMIDWTDWSWNPISGCLHDCSYCYVKSMSNRFKAISMEPKFHPGHIEKFKRVRKVKSGHKIFVGSAADMWGNWNKTEWISEIYGPVNDRPDVIFQFLTKNPLGYQDWFTNQRNCWYGTTIDGANFTKGNLLRLLHNTKGAAVRFASFEPLLNFPHYKDMSLVYLLDWIIIGADSSRGAKKPPNKWADQIINEAREFNIPVWVKDNYGYPEIIKEFPK